MTYQSYFLNFSTPVHFGQGDLTDISFTPCGDTLFSALCHESLKLGGLNALEQLVSWAKSGKLILTDPMPHSHYQLMIRKPMLSIRKEQEGNSVLKKSYKKLQFIPLSKLQTYLKGDLDPIAENNAIKSLGVSQIQSHNRVNLQDDKQPRFFEVGSFRFAPHHGLYIIVGTEGLEITEHIETLFTTLGYSGFGGKATSGYGKFTWEKESLSVSFEEDAPLYLTLSTAMPQEKELAQALEGASYKLIRRGGFVHSSTYSNTPRRKKDFYTFLSGSCFRKRFRGDVYDISGGGSHPVYSYQMPLFLGVHL